MTIVYGPEDALYGTGHYGVARYGSVGPTKIITGVSSSLEGGTFETKGYAVLTLSGITVISGTGSPQLSGGSNKELTNLPIYTVLGGVTVKSVNKVNLEGVALESTLGSPIAEGGQGQSLVLTSLTLQSSIGSIKPNIKTLLVSVPLSLSFDTIAGSGKAHKALPSSAISVSLSTPTTQANTFNFGQFAEAYSSKRTIYIPRSHVPEVA